MCIEKELGLNEYSCVKNDTQSVCIVVLIVVLVVLGLGLYAPLDTTWEESGYCSTTLTLPPPTGHVS